MDFQILDASQRRLFHPESLRTMLGGRLGIQNGKRVTVRALENINLHIRDGDRVGILGHNGSGKSTLLRVLAGIYSPTQGIVESEGRISPMFDISLGMDVDMTAFENMRIQGLLFGMTPAEIDEALPDIIAFTQLDDYLNLPVRTYSSGMMARLSFAIATAKLPDILLLDEVIGAGDAAFQTRAQKRLSGFMRDAKIIVLASHSDEIIRKFCTSAIVLEKGEMVFHGEVNEAIAAYRERVQAQAAPR